MAIRNRFRLDLDLVHRMLSVVPEGGALPSDLRQSLKDLGGEKVRSVREWSDDLGITSRSGRKVVLTPLGRSVLAARSTRAQAAVREIMYYRLTRSHRLVALARLARDYLPEVAHRADATFLVEEAKDHVLRGLAVIRTMSYASGEVATALALLTEERAFGSLALVSRSGVDRYRVASRSPDWRAAAYILYDAWPLGTPRVRLADIMEGPCPLFRTFLMTDEHSLGLMLRLQAERAVVLEIVADLRQVGLNPALKTQDFLEMIAHERG